MAPSRHQASPLQCPLLTLIGHSIGRGRRPALRRLGNSAKSMSRSEAKVSASGTDGEFGDCLPART
jgi:hypothetical protein